MGMSELGWFCVVGQGGVMDMIVGGVRRRMKSVVAHQRVL